MTFALFPSRDLVRAQAGYRLLNDLKIMLPALSLLLLLSLGVYLTALRTLLVTGLVIAVGAFLAGQSVTAVRIRSALSGGLRWIRRGGEARGITTGHVGTWTYAHRTALRAGAVALAAVLFIFWGHPTAAVVVLIAVLLLIALGLIELIGRPASRPGTVP